MQIRCNIGIIDIIYKKDKRASTHGILKHNLACKPAVNAHNGNKLHLSQQ